MKKRFPRSSSTIYHLPSTSPGFTIIELLVVIVIIGILAAISIVTYGGVQNRAVATSLQSDLTNASDQLVIDQAHSSTGVFPDSLEEASSTINWSGDPTPVYTVNNTNTPKTFCLTATKNNQSYFITQEGIPLPGPCPVLYLDASIPTSYPRTGTTWTDLSGNGNNGTMYGGVTYSSTNGGIMTFDGINDYVVIPSLGIDPNNSTIEVSMRETTPPPSYTNWFVSIGSMGGLTDWVGNGTTYAILWGTGGPGYKLVGGPVVNNGADHHLAMSVGSGLLSYYVDGSLIGTADLSGFTINAAGSVNIGAGYWGGSVAIVRIYNRALSATEVKQNYNALKSRYGL